MLHWVIGSLVNKSLVGGFMLIWLEVGMCLTFAVAVSAKGVKFL